MTVKPLSQLLCLLLIAGMTSSVRSAETITIVADEWCPYNCQPGSDTPGLGIEIARTIFGNHGIELKYELLSWADALQSVREGNHSAVIGAFRTDAPDFLFPLSPIAYSRQCFFTRDGSRWDFNGIASLRRIRLGAIDSYSYGTLVDNYIHDNRSSDSVYLVQSETGLVDLLGLIEKGEIDALIEDHNVLLYNFINNAPGTKLRVAGCFPSSKLYIAFSPARRDLSREYIRIFDEGMQELLVDGTIKKITSKYAASVEGRDPQTDDRLRKGVWKQKLQERP